MPWGLTNAAVGRSVRHTLWALPLMSALGCGNEDPTATNPRSVFVDAFETPIEEVRIEAEGGTVVRGYEAWLKLLHSGELKPRREGEYEDMDCAAAVSYFSRVLPADAQRLERAYLDCRGFSDSRFDFDNGRWLVHDSGTGYYYYRVWKHYGANR